MKQFIKRAMKGTGDNDPTDPLRLMPRAILTLEPCMPIFINGPNVDSAVATPGGTAKGDEVNKGLALISPASYSKHPSFCSYSDAGNTV